MIRWDSRAGLYRIEMDDQLRQVLAELMEHLAQLLSDPDSPALHRLFPPAYSDPAHAEMQDEYRRLMQEDLLERRRAECQAVMANASATELDEEQLMAWSRAINSMRLALGTLLDVSEDDPPRSPVTYEESAYHWLSVLLEETIEALSRQT